MNFIGQSASVRRLLDLLERVARTPATVLIRGETGVGKELVAQAVHSRSPRAAQPFVVVDCAALHENLLQSELFGHERGAYTGAFSQKRGLFEAADRGTLFLDEIAELSPALQVKLLRVLDHGSFRRVGGMSDQHVDVRIVAATNRPLERMIERGDFRADLFYRLNVFPLDVPPLRDRDGDVPLLARHFARRAGAPEPALDDAAIERLSAYEWPGNVRELEHVVERALILSDGGTIGPQHLPASILARTARPDRPVAPGAGVPLHELELHHILRVLEEHRGHREHAAAALGISERTLYRRLKESQAPLGERQPV